MVNNMTVSQVNMVNASKFKRLGTKCKILRYRDKSFKGSVLSQSKSIKITYNWQF